MAILTLVKGLFQLSVINWPKFIGPLATVFFTIAYHAGSLTFGYPINAVWIAIFVILGTFTSGLRGGLIAALWGSGYVIYAIDDFGRLVQIVPFLFIYAGIVGWQTRRLRRSVIAEIEARRVSELSRMKAEIFDGLTNGNVNIFKRYLSTLDNLVDSWQTLPDANKLEAVKTARGGIADLITLARGFEEMAKQRGYVIEHER